MDIKTRIDNLQLGEVGEPLKEAIETLRAELEQSAEKQLIQLGKHQGVLTSNGALNLDYKPSKFKDAVQLLNTARSGNNLSAEVLTSWKHSPASKDSNVGRLLSAFVEMGVNMSHQKPEVPMGRQRDPRDDMALTKGRLILDVTTLKKLDTLVAKAERLSNKGRARNNFRFWVSRRPSG